jgi:hypothetical protein
VPCSRHRRASECDVLRLGPLYGFVTVLVGGGGVLLYLRFSKTLGVEEVPALVRTVPPRFGQPPGAHAKG